MNPISQAIQDMRKIKFFRGEINTWQAKYDQKAPKAGDLAPDFSLRDSSGSHQVTLSDFRGQKPVALIFGSFT